MFLFKVLLIFNLIFLSARSDWIKISESPSENSEMIVNDKNSFFQSDLLSEVFNKTNFNSEKIEVLTPNKEWNNYQRQRFATAINSQEILISGTENLKNSAKVVGPINYNGTTANRNFTTASKTNKKVESNIESNKFITVKETLTNDINNNLKINQPLENQAEKLGISGTEKRPVLSNASKQNKVNLDYNKKPIINDKKQPITRGPSFEGFLNFLRTIQNNLISKTSHNIQDKIKKLSDYRDELLINIEERLSNLWPQNKKSKRSITSSESKIDFPTAETALMTISFLTFAVFLIKLVLQVIHTIKSKHYNFSGFAVNNMETINLRRNVRTFGESQSDLGMTANILNAVEKNAEKFR